MISEASFPWFFYVHCPITSVPHGKSSISWFSVIKQHAIANVYIMYSFIIQRRPDSHTETYLLFAMLHLQAGFKFNFKVLLDVLHCHRVIHVTVIGNYIVVNSCYVNAYPLKQLSLHLC